MTGGVGARIRAVRVDRGLTVRGLSESSGVSVGMVSQVERGISEPSLETLRHLARGLGVPLFDFFQPEEARTVAVVRAGGRVRIAAPEGGPSYSRISPGLGRLEMLEGRLGPGDASSPDPWQHPSEECAVVVSGTLTAEVGEVAEELGEGDSCYFDSRLPHRYVNNSTTDVRFIVAITPPSY